MSKDVGLTLPNSLPELLNMPIMPHLKDVRFGLPAGQTLGSIVWGGLYICLVAYVVY